MTSATTRSAGPKGGQDLSSETWLLLEEIVFSQRPRFMAVIREYDLAPPHWIALRALGEPKPMGELAKQLACDSSNVTWITDRLEERGLVERRSAEHDRRVKLLVLTPEGPAAAGGAPGPARRAPAPIAGLSREDQRTLRDILRRAAESVEADR